MAQNIIVFALLSFLLVQPSLSASEKEVKTATGIKVKVKGQSGKVDIGESITMEMDKIAEYAADGKTEVGKSGQMKHSFNTFASLDFTFSEVKSEKYQNIDAEMFDFTSQIEDATLTVGVIVFKATGIIVNDNEEINVTKGMLKTDITISNWTFCNPCKQGNKDEIGQNLQFTITIRGKIGTPEKKQVAGNASRSDRVKAEEYDLGDKVTLVLSKKYKLKDNDVWKDMKSGYPMLKTVGSKKSFVFHFEKFNGTVFYDPNFDFDSGSPTDSGVMAKASLFFTILAVFIAVFKMF